METTSHLSDSAREGSQSFQDNREYAERTAICRALIQTKGNKVKAARILGVARSHLYKKIEQLGIDSSTGKK